MVRRSGGSDYFVVPGVRAALADHFERFGQRWKSERYLELAAWARDGEALTVDGSTIWSALFGVDQVAAEAFLHDKNLYQLIDGMEALTVVADTTTTT